MSTMTAAKPVDKVRENRLRRMAERQGLTLHKSRVRDPRALDFGIYWLVNPSHGGVVYGRMAGDRISYGDQSFDLDDIERFLTGEDDE